jgi:hypothetical protein
MEASAQSNSARGPLPLGESCHVTYTVKNVTLHFGVRLLTLFAVSPGPANGSRRWRRHRGGDSYP